jgi:hypothetical protein
MHTHANSQEVGTSIRWTFGQARDQAKRLGARIVKLIEARADACAAAALYEQLSRLSNAPGHFSRRASPVHLRDFDQVMS